MLCPTCPKRMSCQSACPDLKMELKNIEAPMFENLKSPRQIENILIKQYRPGITDNSVEEEVFEDRMNSETEKPLKTLDEALHSLAPGYLICIQMYYWDGLSPSQIARKLGISRQAVAQRLTSALSIIREQFLTLSLTPPCHFPYSRRVRVLKVAA